MTGDSEAISYIVNAIPILRYHMGHERRMQWPITIFWMNWSRSEPLVIPTFREWSRPLNGGGSSLELLLRADAMASDPKPRLPRR